MKIDAYIIRGRDFCAKDECQAKGCSHEPNMTTKAIHWQMDDGEEYGQECMVTLPLSARTEETIDQLLWHQYEQWDYLEGQD